MAERDSLMDLLMEPVPFASFRSPRGSPIVSMIPQNSAPSPQLQILPGCQVEEARLPAERRPEAGALSESFMELVAQLDEPMGIIGGGPSANNSPITWSRCSRRFASVGDSVAHCCRLFCSLCFCICEMTISKQRDVEMFRVYV